MHFFNLNTNNINKKQHISFFKMVSIGLRFGTALPHRIQQLSSTYNLKLVISGIDTESLVDDPDSDPLKSGTALVCSKMLKVRNPAHNYVTF